MSILDRQPKKIKQFVKSHGHLKIKKLEVCREPIASIFNKILKLARKTPLKRFTDKYDEIFHLFLKLTLEDKSVWQLEKNQRMILKKWKP